MKFSTFADTFHRKQKNETHLFIYIIIIILGYCHIFPECNGQDTHIWKNNRCFDKRGIALYICQNKKYIKRLQQ